MLKPFIPKKEEFKMNKNNSYLWAHDSHKMLEEVNI